MGFNPFNISHPPSTIKRPSISHTTTPIQNPNPSHHPLQPPSLPPTSGEPQLTTIPPISGHLLSLLHHHPLSPLRLHLLCPRTHPRPVTHATAIIRSDQPRCQHPTSSTIEPPITAGHPSNPHHLRPSSTNTTAISSGRTQTHNPIDPTRSNQPTPLLPELLNAPATHHRHPDMSTPPTRRSATAAIFPSSGHLNPSPLRQPSSATTDPTSLVQIPTNLPTSSTSSLSQINPSLPATHFDPTLLSDQPTLTIP